MQMGQPPEPREGAAAHVTGKYLLVAGGCSAVGRCLGDTRALDLYRWGRGVGREGLGREVGLDMEVRKAVGRRLSS